MNNEKLNIQYLIDAVSAKTGNTKKDTENQIKNFVQVLRDALLSEGNVKIKGLGSFKLVWNKSRKSVNVQTGAEIEIAGHYKIDFTPENSLRDYANQPFAHLENIILDEDIDVVAKEKRDVEEAEKMQKLSAQALEIKSLISDINSTSATEPTNTGNNIVTPENTDTNETDGTDMPYPATDSNSQDKEQEVTEEKDIAAAGTATEEEEENMGEDDEAPTANTKKKSNSIIWWILFILALIVLGVGAAFYLNNKTGSTPPPAPKETVDDSEQADPYDTDLATADSAILTPTETEAEDTVYDDDIQQPDFCNEHFKTFDINDCETLTEVTVTAGARLAWYSTKYYGSYVFWPYIYAANKDQMSSPDDLERGQKLRIPKLPTEMTDTTNTTAIRWCSECLGEISNE